jgi:hypothetical protein
MEETKQESPVAPSITFCLIDPEVKPGEYMSAQNPSPYFRLGKPELSLSYLQAKDSIVIPNQPKIRVLFSYPMRNPCVRELKTSDDKPHWTRGALAYALAREYKKIYDEESLTSTIPEGPHERLVYNRNETNGTHGLCHHFLHQLCLTSVAYDAKHEYFVLSFQ